MSILAFSSSSTTHHASKTIYRFRFHSKDQQFFSPTDVVYTDLEILKLLSRDEPRNAWQPYRGFDATTLDSLSVVMSVGGVCAERLAFGNAEGGYADLSQLRQFMASSSTELTDQEMEKKIDVLLDLLWPLFDDIWEP
eukprot:scaffold66225_cov39-Attheya_sp.AAC.4